VVWVTDEDRAAFESAAAALAPARSAGGPPSTASSNDAAMPPFTTISICVDPTATPPLRRAAGAHRVTFLGGMHWPPNAAGIEWFAREVWPTLSQEVPDARLTILGKSPPEPLRRLAAADERVEAPGYVDDPLPLLAETAAFVVPLFAGGGMRVKIAEAWCWGLPVVTTTVGGEGMAVADGQNALVADDAASFARATTRLLRDRPFADTLAAAGRDTAERCYDWRKVYGAWDGVYAGLRNPHPHLASLGTPSPAAAGEGEGG
jgi:hypothetical protein